jgi:protocatechuate 3,4-dioxygenase beta subunit
MRSSTPGFLRGVQMTDSAGLVRFTTIYPGWYSGRITHVHFRAYLGNALQATSQLAFPQDTTRAVYQSSLYAARGQNTSVTVFQRGQRILGR